MKMAQELELLKQETSTACLPISRRASKSQQGQPAHEVELSLRRQLLNLGRQLFARFLALLGSGDMGETITLSNRQTCQRLPERHKRRLVTIFGAFELERTAYGSREGQKIEFVPLDNRLQLPESEFSYVLQDWDQELCVEEAFGKAASTVARILGFKQSVDSLERMNVQMSNGCRTIAKKDRCQRPRMKGRFWCLAPMAKA